jgi:hypothetical protein
MKKRIIKKMLIKKRLLTSLMTASLLFSMSVPEGTWAMPVYAADASANSINDEETVYVTPGKPDAEGRRLLSVEKTGSSDLYEISYDYLLPDDAAEKGLIESPEDHYGDGVYAESEYNGSAEADYWGKFSGRYFYDSVLNEDEKLFYDKLYDVSMELLTDESLDISLSKPYPAGVSFGNLSPSEGARVMRIFRYENPQFYFYSTAFNTSYKSKGGVVEYYGSLAVYTAFVDGAERAACTEKVRKNIEDIYGSIPSDCDTTLEKERYIHDKLADLIVYKKSTYDQSCYSVLGMIGESEIDTVCAGYAQSFELLMNGLGVPTVAISGGSYPDDNSKGVDTAHEWNKIKISDEWFIVDVTWDDNKSGNPYSKYFNRSDEQTAYNDKKDHPNDAASIQTFTVNGVEYNESCYAHNEMCRTVKGNIYKYDSNTGTYAWSEDEPIFIWPEDTPAANLDSGGTYTKLGKDPVSIDPATVSFSQDSYEYTGDPVEPEVTVKKGDVILKEYDDYILSYSNNVNIGKATVSINGVGFYKDFVTAEFQISEGRAKAAPPPEGLILKYNGEAQKLVKPGTGKGGIVNYSFKEDADFSTEIPEATLVGDYTVYYKVISSDPDYKDSLVSSVTASIVQADNSWVVAPSMAGWRCGETPSAPVGEAKYGTVSFNYFSDEACSEEVSLSENLPVGVYRMKATVAEDKDRYKGLEATVSFNVARGKATILAAPKPIEGLIVNGLDQQLVTPGQAKNGTIYYSLYADKGFTWMLPKARDVGSYTVYYMIRGDENFEGTEIASVSVNISDIPEPGTVSFNSMNADEIRASASISKLLLNAPASQTVEAGKKSAMVSAINAPYTGWIVSNEDLAKVYQAEDNSAGLDIKAPGTFYLTACNGRACKSIKYTVNQKTRSLKTNVTEVELTEGACFRLTATPDRVTTDNFIWSSSNPAACTVNAFGIVKAKQAVNAPVKITVTTVDKTGFTAKAEVLVRIKAKGTAPVVKSDPSALDVKMLGDDVEMKVGELGFLCAEATSQDYTSGKPVRFKSSGAVKVDKYGHVTAKKAGTGYVWAQCGSLQSQRIQINVSQPVKSFKLNKTYVKVNASSSGNAKTVNLSAVSSPSFKALKKAAGSADDTITWTLQTNEGGAVLIDKGAGKASVSVPGSAKGNYIVTSNIYDAVADKTYSISCLIEVE